MSTETNETLQLVIKLLNKIVGGSETSPQMPVIKQLDDEKMVAVEWLFPVEQDDLTGERIDLDEARNMVEGINKAIKKGKLSTALNHAVPLEGVTIEKAWVNEVECLIGETVVPEGWPLAMVKFHNKELWEARKNGTLMGLSIGCFGSVEEVEE